MASCVGNDDQERVRRFAISIFAGLIVFAVSYSGVLHGIFSPPTGYHPAYFEQTLDTGAYLSWLADSRDHWLLPNRHVPYITEPALFQPMMLLIGKTAKLLGVSSIAVYYALQILLYMGAVYALMFCAGAFLRTQSERVAAGAVVVCSLPLFLYLYGLERFVPMQRNFDALGVVGYAYQTADGFLRGGLSNGPNLTFGTITMLLAFGFLGRFVESGGRSDFAGLCVCAFANAFVHPFEVYVFMTSAIVSIGVLRYREGRGKSILPLALMLAASAGLGMLPWIVQTARYQWLRDASDANQFSVSPMWALVYFGLPSFATIYLLLLRFRMRERSDLVLQCWFLSSCLLLFVPAIPAGMHLFDGFVYGQAFLLVRRAGQDRQLPRLFQMVRRPALAAAFALVSLSTLALGSMWVQIYHDGNSTAPQFISAIRRTDEADALSWLGSHAKRDSLVLAPSALTPWVAGLALNTFGSHDVLSVQYPEQTRQLDRLYSGMLTDAEVRSFLTRYGFEYAVVPSNSKLGRQLGGDLLQTRGKVEVYSLDLGTMKSYPSAGLNPDKGRNSIRQGIFSFLGRLITLILIDMP